MLIWLLAAALAGPIEGKVVVDRVGVPDARVEAVGADGIALGAPVYTDRRGRFVIDVPSDATVRASRWIRTEGGTRLLAVADDVPADDARRVSLDRVDVGGGRVRLVGSRMDDAKSAIKAVRKRYADVQEACVAVLDAEERTAARDAATERAATLAVGWGTGFEGCALRRFGETTVLEVAERTTHNLDAAAGPGGQPLWAGLASVGFAEWAIRNGDPMRARRAAGAAVTRLGGLTGSRGGTSVAESARVPLARAYEIEGEAAMQQGDPPGAVSKFHQSLRVYKQTGDVVGMGRSELGIARAELARGRLDAASEHLTLARALPLGASHRAMLDEASTVLSEALAAQTESAEP